MEEVKKPTITITNKAILAFRKELCDRKVNPRNIRLGVKGGSCSGYSFVIEYGAVQRNNDTQFNFDGFGVVIDPKSLEILDGLQIDREESLMRQEFSFTSPQIKSHCGCKKSFSIA
jgi:iron-sulfur cluster assembly protein